MCTNIVETTEIFGSGKGAAGWMRISRANVFFDHPHHVPVEHALAIDFVGDGGPSARIAVEMSAESARALIAKIEAALARGDAEHAAPVPAGG